MDQDKKMNGAFVGLTVIIIILIIGGIYIWQSNKTSVPAESGTVTNQDSASLDALDQDANNTNASAGVDANTVY